MPELDFVGSISVALVGAAADVDEFGGHLGVETQRVEGGVAGRSNDPLVGAGDGVNDLVGAGRHFGTHECASLGYVVYAADGTRELALGVHASKCVRRVTSSSDVGEVGGREGSASPDAFYAFGDAFCLGHCGFPFVDEKSIYLFHQITLKDWAIFLHARRFGHDSRCTRALTSGT